MKIETFIFTYSEDKDYIPFCVEALKRIHLEENDTLTINIIDDKNAKAYNGTKEALEHCRADNYILSSFNRGGNLNGVECVEGMLDLYDAVSKDTDWVVQVDSDVMLRSFEHLRDTTAELIGGAPYDGPPFTPAVWRMPFVVGPGMAIRREFVPTLKTILAMPDIHERCANGIGYSDQLISRLAELADANIISFWSANAPIQTDNLALFEHRITTDLDNDEYAKKASIIHVDKKYLPSKDVTLSLMQEVLDKLCPLRTKETEVTITGDEG